MCSLFLMMLPANNPEAYRARYAAYLAATFGISVQAAAADVDSVLKPKKRYDITEAEVAPRPLV